MLHLPSGGRAGASTGISLYVSPSLAGITNSSCIGAGSPGRDMLLFFVGAGSPGRDMMLLFVGVGSPGRDKVLLCVGAGSPGRDMLLLCVGAGSPGRDMLLFFVGVGSPGCKTNIKDYIKTEQKCMQ